MHVRVYFFSYLQEIMGVQSMEVTLESEFSVRGLKMLLSEKNSALADQFKRPNYIKCAVNREFTDESAKLKNNDEVAFFPPVTGG